MARKDLAQARAQLDQPKAPFADKIHAVRTALKKVRASVRMVRPAQRQARKENRRLREVARSVGWLREQEVVLGTLDALLRDGPGGKAQRVPRLRAYFSARLRAAEQSFQAAHGLRRLKRELGRARRRTSRWSKAGAKWGSVGPGTVQQYRTARERMALAESGSTFHAWRRAAKSHRHQLHALLEVWPKELHSRIEKLDRLADLLGEEHDLTVLESELAHVPGRALDPADRDEVLRRLRRRRDQCRSEARALGLQVFREDPATFERRLKAAFKTARRPA